LAGGDRYATSVAIAAAAYPDSAKVVYVATGENYPDALSAAPAAVKEGGPLLLVPPAGVPDLVTNEIRHLAPQQIVVVGGPTTVSDTAFTQLSALAPTVRISGTDRYETSRLVTARAFPGPVTKAFVATGFNFPDALSASAVAAGSGAPVILVPGTHPSVDTATTSFIQNKGITNIAIAGDENAVTAQIRNQLDALPGVTVQRFSGVDRFTTSGAINHASFTTTSNAYFATGTKFPDALAGAALAGAKHAPLYVVPDYCAPAYDLQDIAAYGVTTITLLGDSTSLSTNVQNLTPC
jgi:putative cell wall-binding protein